jgi:cell division protease FtsH
MTLPKEDSFTMTREKCEAMISFLMGGRIAEDLTFGHLTSGASNDIERATEIARRMVTEWGMSEKLGPLNYGNKNENIFLGREMTSGTSHGDEIARTIDAEIKAVVDRNYSRAVQILSENKDILKSMSEALLERETIGLPELDLLMARKPLPPMPSGGTPSSSSGSSTAPGKSTLVVDPSDPVKA